MTWGQLLGVGYWAVRAYADAEATRLRVEAILRADAGEIVTTGPPIESDFVIGPGLASFGLADAAPVRDGTWPWPVDDGEDRCLICGRDEEEAEALHDYGLVAEYEGGPWYCAEHYPGDNLP